MGDTPELRAEDARGAGREGGGRRASTSARCSRRPTSARAPEDGSAPARGRQGQDVVPDAHRHRPRGGATGHARGAAPGSTRAASFPEAGAAEVVLNARLRHRPRRRRCTTPARRCRRVEQMLALMSRRPRRLAQRRERGGGRHLRLGTRRTTSGWACCRSGCAQRLLRMEGRVTEYAVAVEPLEAADETRDAAARRRSAPTTRCTPGTRSSPSSSD